MLVYYLDLLVLGDPCSLKFDGASQEFSGYDKFGVGGYMSVWEAMCSGVNSTVAIIIHITKL